MTGRDVGFWLLFGDPMIVLMGTFTIWVIVRIFRDLAKW